jgi:hypothetical protein
MEEIGTRPNGRVRRLLRHPDSHLIGALALAALVAAAWPTDVAQEHLPQTVVAVTGIGERPAYAFDPGPGFFDPLSLRNPPDRPDGASPMPGDGVLRLRVEEFGAVADPAVDNRQAIQDAIDHVHARGGGVILLGEGTYGVAGDPRGPGAIKLKSNTFLQGAGMGRSTLRVVDGWSGTLVGLVRTPWGQATLNYGLADLTLDGNRTGTSGKIDAFYSGGMPGGTVADEDAWVLRVEARDVSGYGFDPHERTVRLTIADSLARNNGLDGFVADFVVDSVYRGNIAIGNERHGFNIVTSSSNLIVEDNVAKGNGGAGLVVQRGSDPIPSPHDIRIADMRLTDNGREGALIRMSRNVELRNVLSTRNGTYGVRIQGSQDVILRDRIVMDNSLNGRTRFAAIQIRDEDDTVHGRSYPSRGIIVRDNVIGWQVPVRQRSAVQELAGDVAGTVVSGNRFRGLFRTTLETGYRQATARNHRFEAARIRAALSGAVRGLLPIEDTADCRSRTVRPGGCAFPEVRSLGPAGQE